MKQLFFAKFWLTIVFFAITSVVFAQSNRLTNENGQLLWQYNQIVHLDTKTPNTLLVSFVFINGVKQTAITLRQELFNSQIEWLETTAADVEKEDRVEFLTVNLVPHQSVVWKYLLKNKPIENKLLLEKSAVLIMNENFEVRKEVMPEQRIAK